MNPQHKKHPVICFGEVLWDILPHAQLPGGAPVNVAYHLHKLGLHPAVITRTGKDAYGERLLHFLNERGLSSQFFQLDAEHPTGLVYATTNAQHEVNYEIVFPAAWDFIEPDKRYFDLIAEASFLVFGSLASRHEVSRNTLNQLLELSVTKVVDINLRPPHYTQSHVEFLVSKADVLKMNQDELELIAGWSSNYKNNKDRILHLQDHFKLEHILVTLGAHGAIINERGKLHEHPGFTVKVADTIGSGDAFLAGYLSQISKGATTEQVLAFSCAMGAFIASQSGACPDYELEQVISLMNSTY